MSALFWVVIVLASLTFLCIIFIIVRAYDWRAFFVRRYGPTNKKGLAHTKISDTWVYRESELFYESDYAWTYTRTAENGELIDEIVPKYDQDGRPIKYGHDEYTGALVYKSYEGGVVCTTDDGDPPKVNMPAALIAVETMGKLAYDLTTSVKSDSQPFNWKPLALIGIIAIIAVIGLFALGILKFPVSGGPPADPDQTEIPAPAETGPSANATIIFSDGE